jgi:aminobenzoyl-glutamate transport protein
MRKNKKKADSQKGPVSTILAFIVFISIASLILSLVGFQGYTTSLTNGVLADSLVNVKNIFSVEGLRFIIGESVTNFQNFEPLVLFIISIIGISICEKSGFLNIVFGPLKKVKFGVIVYFTIVISLLCTVLGEYSYVFLIPLTGAVYKYLDRNPILGVLISFLSITLGYGTGIIFNYHDYNLGLLTQTAATADVDPNFVYSLTSTMYVMLASLVLLSFVLYVIINRFLVSKFSIKSKNEEELINSKKGFGLALVALFSLILLVVYMVLDVNLPGAGILLDHSSDTYIAKLFSEDSPFREGIVPIIAIIMMITGYVYGKVSGNIKNSSEYSLGLSKNFENLGLLFVLMFFVSQLFAILEWTNIGTVIAANLITFVSHFEFSGVLLIIMFFIIVVLMSIFMPDATSKWKLASPVIVPLFMRSNIAPQFTQFVFKVADAVGKSFSPIYVYFIIMLAFLQKYNTDERRKISLFGTFKLMLPTIVMISVFWLVFVSLWFLIGIPIGPGTYTTL